MKIKSLLATVVGISTLAFSSAMWASLPLENRLTPIVDTGLPAIGFTGVNIEYKPGKTKKRGNGTDTVFFAESTAGSVLTLIGPDEAYPDVTGGDAAVTWTGTADDFVGDFLIDVKISPKGTFKEGTFGFWSTDGDARFTGEPYVDYNCNKKGRNCDSGQLIYGGTLTSFGWSDAEGILEFGLTNQEGWAWDLWGIAGSTFERIIMQVGALGIDGANSVTSWTATNVYGIAIVPVPAAVWLFGAGLLGLVGVARRKQA